MKRAFLVSMGTVAGAAAVLAYQPGALFSSGGSTAQAATTTTSAATSTSATYTGDSVETGYGPVQVEITVAGSTVTAVTAVTAPNGDPRSSQISAYAIPQLEQQAVTAQSAKIDGVSGASYTSAGFAQSLQSALTQAGIG